MSNNMAKIADARKTVEQLKLEVNIERMMVSEDRRWCQYQTRRHVSWFSVKCGDDCYYSQTMKSLFSRRCPRPPQIWWPTVRITPRRTLWWPRFLPLRTPLGRRSSSAPYYNPGLSLTTGHVKSVTGTFVSVRLCRLYLGRLTGL